MHFGLYVLLAALPVCALAQEPPRSRYTLASGAALFNGTDGEAGVGLFARVAAVIARPGRGAETSVELAGYRFHSFGQLCPLVPDGGCTPEDPPGTVWSARLGLLQRLGRSATAPFALFGVGPYTNIGRAGEPVRTALGLDLGLGLPVSARVALELRFIYLHTTRPRAWASPLGLSVRL